MVADPRVGQNLGASQIVDEIGHGGMGAGRINADRASGLINKIYLPLTISGSKP